MAHLLSQNDTDACFDDFTFEHTLVVFVVEHLDISGTAIVQTIFDGDVVDKCFILLGGIGSCNLYAFRRLRHCRRFPCLG